MCKRGWSISSLPCWQNCPVSLEHPSSRRSLSPCLWSALHGDAELAWLHSLGPLPVLRYSLTLTQHHFMSTSVRSCTPLVLHPCLLQRCAPSWACACIASQLDRCAFRLEQVWCCSTCASPLALCPALIWLLLVLALLAAEAKKIFCWCTDACTHQKLSRGLQAESCS